jgi:hypothetical protein
VSPEKPEPGYVPQPVPTALQVPAVPQLPVPVEVNVHAAAYAGVVGRAANASMTIAMTAAALNKKDVVLDLAFIILLGLNKSKG